MATATLEEVFIFPLSFAQERLWLVDQLAPHQVSYNISRALRLEGPLDIPALTEAITEIRRRHEVLRTIFKVVEGMPCQVITPEATLPVPVLDLQTLAPEAQSEQTQSLAYTAAQTPFELSTGPLMRVQLLKLAEHVHVFLITVHHIIADAWSVAVFSRELSSLYNAFTQGKSSPLPEPSIQYADFAEWQKQTLPGALLDTQLSYWRQQLADIPPHLVLPTDRPRSNKQTVEAGTIRFQLSEETTQQLKALSQSSGATLFMTLLAAFQILLCRYTGQTDVVVGTDIANRHQLDLEELIGFFVNQLVLRTDCSGNPPFHALLDRVRQVVLDAYAHQDLPFNELVKALKPERSRGQTPFFQVSLVFENAPPPTLKLPNLTLKPLEIEKRVTQNELTLFVWEKSQCLQGVFEYSTDLFEAATVAKMVQQFQTLLADICDRPHAPLKQLHLLNETERTQQAIAQQADKRSKLSKLKAIRPKLKTLSQDTLVETTQLLSGSTLPLMIKPTTAGLDLVDWAKHHQGYLERELLKHGALLFRGFNQKLTTPKFEQFTASLARELLQNNGEHIRATVSGRVYTPVFYPAEQKILWHNENSFNRQVPLKIWFGCVQPAQQGGETPIVDSRQVFEQMPDPIKSRFVDRQIMYVRNYGQGAGLPWQTVFQTEDKAQVEQHCRDNGMTFEWKSGDRLQASCVRPAVIQHPKTGEMSWFNQAQHWHLSCLDTATRQSLLTLFAAEDLPRNCYYGNGSPIADEDMATICEVYQQLEVSFPWQQGDIVMLDNLLSAHARNSFSGERNLLVAMGDSWQID
ncbi:MAG: condensation domain-containing protein [Phormidesmis sp.]